MRTGCKPLPLKPEEQKEYLGLLQENSKIFAERDTKIEGFKKQVQELKVSALELFTPADFTPESALELMVNLQAVHHFSAEQLGVKAPKAGKVRVRLLVRVLLVVAAVMQTPSSSRFRASRVVLSTTKAASMNKQLPA